MARRPGAAALLGGAAVAVALALAGCGGSSGSGSSGPSGSTSSSASTTSAVPTSSAAPAGAKVAGATLAHRVQAAITRAGSARFAIDESGTKGGGVIDLRQGGLRASIALKDGTDNIKAVVLPGVLYVNSGEVVQGKHWIKLSGTLHAATLKTARAQILSGIGVVSPAVQAASWRSVGSFTTGPTSTIGGAPATEYDGTVPKARFIAAFPAQARSEVRITGDVKVRVWLDARDRPVKLEVTAPFSDGLETDTTTFSAWGSAPAIKLPPKSDTLSGAF